MPDDAEDFAFANLVLDAFLKAAPDPSEWVELLTERRFVLGNRPCVLDLILAQAQHPAADWISYQQRVTDWYNRYAK